MTDVSGGRAIRPVILAGGAGTRLWPLSTIQRPKHLLPLLGNWTLFEQTLDRFGEQFFDPGLLARDTALETGDLAFEVAADFGFPAARFEVGELVLPAVEQLVVAGDRVHQLAGEGALAVE